jgi:hypothetical protein
MSDQVTPKPKPKYLFLLMAGMWIAAGYFVALKVPPFAVLYGVMGGVRLKMFMDSIPGKGTP